MKKTSGDVLCIEELKIGYASGRKEKIILPSLSASAHRGELVAVIGRNGIGKSTLLRTIAGLQSSLGGAVRINEKRIEEHTRMELAQKLGYISTENISLGNMSVYDLVALGRFPHTNWIGKIDSENQAAILDALEKTSIIGLKECLISEISDGERQKAMIARIIAQDAGILIMDEPTAFLDTGSKFEILHLMNNLSKESGKTIIFSTHDLNTAMSQADKIWLITGKELLEGAPEDLMMSGAFDHLFDSSNVHFNPVNGTFSFSSVTQGSVFIDGDATHRLWIEKALKRIGLSVAGEKRLPCIIIDTEGTHAYHLIKENGTTYHDSIYELVSSLKKGHL